MMRKRLFILLVLTLVSLSVGRPVQGQGGAVWPNLKGQFIAASPRMSDPRFTKAVILIIDHDDGGAMGLIINRRIGQGTLGKFLVGVGMEPPGDSAAINEQTVRMHYGGPVDHKSLFVLHSRDVAIASSRPVLDNVAVTFSNDVLKLLARGLGPRHHLMVMGYSGWGPGQLESEIERESWLSAPADSEMIFGDEPKAVWAKVFKGGGLKL